MARHFNNRLGNSTRVARAECISYTLDANGEKQNVRIITKAANAPRPRTTPTVKVQTTYVPKSQLIREAMLRLPATNGGNRDA